ncbi:protein-L-isoaspartate(D-aspartate) O-methyltransferase [Streptomyces sp. NPDC013457]|uniref:protein-L-isoaspartate(D-aspartate) O-methyltransferase n=1 Tax=Streptomyces sp. NPDC013457 TaxID=3364866 RepID=UPI0036FAF387
MTARTREAGPQGLASALVEAGALHAAWLPAFTAVPRDVFTPDRIWPGIAAGTQQNSLVDRATDPDGWVAAVYSDIPLTTQWDDGSHQGDGLGTMPSSSLSQPSMVFSMLADLDVKQGHRVLKIGTGSGWNAGLLTHRVGPGNLVTVEYDAQVAEGAVGNLRKAGLSPLVVVADGRAGFTDRAPYDRVIATCSVTEVPAAWIEQTVPGGVIVAPWAPLYGGEAIMRLMVADDGGTASGHFTRSSAFMRLRQQRGDFPPNEAYFHGMQWPGNGTRSTSRLSPVDGGGWLEQFVIGLRVRDVFWRTEQYDDGSYTLWTHSMDTTSWASADYLPGAEEFEIVQSGPRALWDETETAYRWWTDQGRPGFHRFGLTITPDGQQAWLDDPATSWTI